MTTADATSPEQVGADLRAARDRAGLTRAQVDALAAALAVGSLGDYFPEDDPADQDTRSIEFLARFRPILDRERAKVINIDCTIFCAAPRIGPAAHQMRSNIADGLGCDRHRINVKGKTNDGFGPEGQGEAISATVLVQLRAG
jgi:2-C-methyl-D-erythritol 2,4-cyclodiphosphate synthase